MERSRRGLLRTAGQSAKGLIFIVLGTVMLASCSSATESMTGSASSSPEQQPKSVNVIKVGKNQITDVPEIAADIVPSLSLDIIAKAGGDVEKILKNRGDRVKKGEAIVKLHSADAEFRREQALLALRTAQTVLQKTREQAFRELKNATVNYNKIRNDYDDGLATKDQLDQAQNQLKNVSSPDNSNLQIGVENARVALQQTDQEIASLTIEAPEDGILTDMQISEGMTVHQGTKVGVVQNLDPIKLEGQMTAAQTALLKGADELPFYVPGTSIKASGKIVYVSNVANAQTDKYELDLEAVNPGMNLKPGMKAQIQLGNKQDLMALSVPTYSIVKEDGNAYVFVLNHDTVEKRKVQLGRLNEPIQEIVSGLKEGEFVVVSGQNRLKDKEKVGMVNVQTQNKAG